MNPQAKENYLESPCRASSIPYWKAKTVSVPDSMKILHDEDFTPEFLQWYTDEQYFRLIHKTASSISASGLEGLLHLPDTVTKSAISFILHRSSLTIYVYTDEQYFRLIHNLQNLEPAKTPNGYSVCKASIKDFAEHINKCYNGNCTLRKIRLACVRCTCN